MDTERLGYDANEECVQMPPTRPAYPPEFRVEAVRLFRTSDRSLKAVAADLGISTNSLRGWVRRAEMDEATPEELGEDETQELKRLRREVRVLIEEREILRMSLTPK